LNLPFRTFVLVLALASGCAAPAARVPSQSSQADRFLPIPADLRERAELAEDIGAQLYVLDKAAWIATDVLEAKVGNLETAGIGGYLPLREGDSTGKPVDSFIVSFFSSTARDRIAYEVRVFFSDPAREASFQAFDPPKAAQPGLPLLIQARESAIAAIPEIIQPMNPVVLPAFADGEKGMLVYLLAATKQPNVAVFGRHYRVLVGEDFKTVKDVRPLSHSVLEVPIAPQKDGKIVGLMVSHLVTESPLETHVFTSLLHGIPVYVATSRGDWLVDGDEIRFLRPRSIE
jgi:hypothetical protein